MQPKKNLSKSRSLWIVVLLILVGAILRFGGIGREPLRGDEAFAVRYWADSPNITLEGQTGLAWREPHPLGVFVGFWGWRSLMGSGEVPMRTLSALLNLLGIPAIYALALRLQTWADSFTSDNARYRKQAELESDTPPISHRTAAAAALLYALNPTLVWHSQDMRNYGPWVGLSLISLWLGVRLITLPNHQGDRWRYGIAAASAIYTFFLEGFLILVQGWLALLSGRRTLRRWIEGLLLTFIVCLPLVYQVYRLANSGYRGALTGADLRALPAFFDSLMWGEFLPGAPPPTLLLLIASLVIIGWRSRRLGLWLAGGLIIPSVLLTLVSTRLDVFGSRYLIALLPLMFLIFVLALRSVSQQFFPLTVGAIALLSLISLGGYFSPENHKAPDWYGLRDYLKAHVQPGDTVIMTSPDAATGVLDPAFGYYYRLEVPLLPLPYPGIDTGAKVREVIAHSERVWFIVSGTNAAGVDAALREAGVLISDERAGRSFLVRAYRKP
ncbi:hypothetical protein ANRL4_02006 [Anaerolineae bacterium]|nr:hypothetical protein ANRL4_02006 [Anaerolineae bacterium]